MDQVLERRPAPEAIPEIEATLNYFVNDGSKIFTEAAGAGERDKRAGTIDPHKVVIHNGRLHGAESGSSAKASGRPPQHQGHRLLRRS